jgi:hypothetical protein
MRRYAPHSSDYLELNLNLEYCLPQTNQTLNSFTKKHYLVCRAIAKASTQGRDMLGRHIAEGLLQATELKKTISLNSWSVLLYKGFTRSQG